ncbi:MAG: type II toxin-antitoxin system VapC family toxin [Terriglobia bacterium]
MILLDTNVLSEGTKPKPSESVLRWLDAQDALSIFTTSISQAEILYGIERLPAGKRRSRLSAAATKTFAEDFDGRILPFDRDAAAWYAKVVAERESAGRPISQFDAMIAAIARSHKATLATRNTADFEGCGIQLINPWS